MSTSPIVTITDELLAELEEIQNDASDVAMDADSQEYLGSLAGRLLSHIADLKQQLAAAGVTADNCELFRKDAERYRWLRDDALKCTFAAPAIMVVDEAGNPVHKGNPWNSLIMDEDADAAIDAARSAGKDG